MEGDEPETDAFFFAEMDADILIDIRTNVFEIGVFIAMGYPLITVFEYLGSTIKAYYCAAPDIYFILLKEVKIFLNIWQIEKKHYFSFRFDIL